VSHASDADELLEVLGDELRPVVADEAWPFARILLAGALQNGFHVDFLHFLADFPVDDVAAEAVEDRTQEVEGAGDVQVADIDMPVLMRFEGLHEAGALLGGPGRLPGQESRRLEHAVDAGRAARHMLRFGGVEHHEGHATITFMRMAAGEGADPLLLVTGEPVIARHPGVVLVDLAEAGFPVVELAGADAEPGQETPESDLRLVAPGADEIDELIAAVMGHPASLQISPSSFFKRVWASMSSAMTSFLRVSLASSCSIFLTLASSTDLALRPFSKARWDFSKT